MNQKHKKDSSNIEQKNYESCRHIFHLRAYVGHSASYKMLFIPFIYIYRMVPETSVWSEVVRLVGIRYAFLICSFFITTKFYVIRPSKLTHVFSMPNLNLACQKWRGTTMLQFQITCVAEAVVQALLWQLEISTIYYTCILDILWDKMTLRKIFCIIVLLSVPKNEVFSFVHRATQDFEDISPFPTVFESKT